MGKIDSYKGIEILYEDNHIIVAIKPAGLLSQSDRKGEPDILSLLKAYIKETKNKPGDAYLGLVHRLDRPVGGVMVFAKTSKAAARLSEQIRERTIEKIYIARVAGIVQPPKGTLHNYLAKDADKNKAFEVGKNDKRGAEAVLDYEVLSTNEGTSLVKVALRTGRFHQIRAQMALFGYPICGDRKYGEKTGKENKDLSLWASELTFNHPVKPERMSFKAELKSEALF